MERSFPGALVRVVALVLIAALSGRFAAATAPADEGDDPVDEVRRIQAEMWARLSPEDRAPHQRMHEACAGLMTERTER
jgi:hypothetical protein